MLPLFWLTLLGGTSISAGIQKEIVTITSSVSLLKKVLKTVKESDKKSYSLREISKEINLPEYTIRRYISLNKLTVESESNSDNPRKIGYKISKESLLDFLTFNEDDLIKAMDKVKRKNSESIAENSNYPSSENNWISECDDFPLSIEELDIAIKVLKRNIESINLDIEEINLTSTNDLTVEQKRAIIQKKKEILTLENRISLYEIQKMEISKDNQK